MKYISYLFHKLTNRFRNIDFDNLPGWTKSPMTWLIIGVVCLSFTVVSLFSNYAEYRETHKATRESITQAYREILKREPDEGGMNTYLLADMTTEEVRASIQNSDEKKLLDSR